MRAFILAALLAGGAAVLASAQGTQESAAGLPAALDPGAPEGAVPTAHSDRPFDRYALPISRYGSGPANAREIEGRVIWSSFRLDTADVSTAEVMEGYRTRLAALGYRPILDCATTACGGFHLRSPTGGAANGIPL